MSQFIKKATNFVLDTIFPQYCFGCRTEGSFLCSTCQVHLTRLAWQECIICRKPSSAGVTHDQCRHPLCPDQLISTFDYHDPLVAELLITGKYKFLPNVYRLLTEIMAPEVKEYLTMTPEVTISPIPLAKPRLRWRGFNQAQIMGEVLTKTWGIPSALNLQRTKSTKTQKDLDKVHRVINMQNAFAVDKAIRKETIIVVDDVLTTGSTLLEASRVLKTAGAKVVICLTLARD